MSRVVQFSGFDEIYDYHIKKVYSKHDELYLKARLTLEQFENSDTLFGKVVNADVINQSITEEDKLEKNIFLGVIDSVEMSNNNSWYCTVIAHSFTMLMDKELHNRIFQNQKKTLADIIEAVCSAYDGIVVKGEGTEQIAVPDTIIQYMESDWSFLTKLCKKYGCEIVSNQDFNSESEGTLWIGKINRGANELLPEKIVSKSLYDGEVSYSFRDDVLLEMGDKISYKNREYTISGCDFYMENMAFIKEYTISSKVNGCEYNSNLEGLIINAEVIALEGDGKEKGQIQVQFEWEEEKPTNPVWIDWVTPYYNDTVGVYNMPEMGNQVLVQVIDSCGSKLIAQSCVRQSKVEDELKVTDKLFRIGEKEILINDSLIRIKNKDAVIEVEDEKITIKTKKGNWELSSGGLSIGTDSNAIKIKSGDIEIKGEKIQITGSSMEVKCPSIELKGNVQVK